MRPHSAEGTSGFLNMFSLIMIGGVVFSLVAALVRGPDAFVVGLIITSACALAYSGAYHFLNLVRAGNAPNTGIRSDAIESATNGGATVPWVSRSQRIRELDELRAGSHINDAEYRSKRQQILDDL